MFTEILALVILMALFFGVSFGAALHGMLSFVGWTIVIVIAISLLSNLFKTTPPRPQPQPLPQPKPQPFFSTHKPKSKIGKEIFSVMKWAFGLFGSYCITMLLLTTVFYYAQKALPPLLGLLLPLLPFTLFVCTKIIIRIVNKVKAKNKQQSTKNNKTRNPKSRKNRTRTH